MKQPGKHLLIIRLSALGDVAMTIPVIYSLAHQHPQLKITVLTREFFSRLFIDRPDNLHIAIADTKGRHAGAGGLMRLIREIRRTDVDMVADFHDILRSRIIDAAMSASGVPVKIVDKARRKRRKLTHRGKNEAVQQTPYIDRYLHVLKQLGLSVTLDFTHLFSGARRNEAIGIAPFARYSTKTYPTDLMEKVVAHFAATGKTVYLFGSKGAEADILSEWEKKYPGCKSMPGKLKIEEELQLMASLAVMVTMDSANMHLASLVATPVVSVWGSTTPHCGFMGYRQSNHNAVVLNLQCQPCSIAGKPQCPRGDLACLRCIKPATVIEKVEQVLEAGTES